MIKKLFFYRYALFIFCACFLLPACIHKKEIDKHILYLHETQNHEHAQDITDYPPITIWIHGTIFFKKPKNYDIYHKNPTLMPAKLLPEKSRFYSLAKAMCTTNPSNFSMDHYYIFCWSGHFSKKERKSAAKKLYADILSLAQSYKAYYKRYPKITIITHSHGGNLALHMSQLSAKKPFLHIDSLIMLACPVQEKTMHLVNTPLFQKIYSLYSSFDFVQVLAPQIKRIHNINPKTKYKVLSLSSRLFPRYHHLIQAKIKINELPISHSYFSSIKFASMLPTIIETLDTWDQKANPKKYKVLSIHE